MTSASFGKYIKEKMKKRIKKFFAQNFINYIIFNPFANVKSF